jgi:hypothetical protein
MHTSAADALPTVIRTTVQGMVVISQDLFPRLPAHSQERHCLGSGTQLLVCRHRFATPSRTIAKNQWAGVWVAVLYKGTNFIPGEGDYVAYID